MGAVVAQSAGHGQARMPAVQRARALPAGRAGAPCQPCAPRAKACAGYLVHGCRRQPAAQPYQRMQGLPRDRVPPGAAAEMQRRCAADVRKVGLNAIV